MKLLRTWIVIYLAFSSMLIHVAILCLYLQQPALFYQFLDKWPYGRSAISQQPANIKAEINEDQQIQQEIALNFQPWQAAIAKESLTSIWLDNQFYPDLPSALRQLKDNSHLKLPSGVYQTAITVRHHNVTIEGIGHVVFEREAVAGKGFILAQGDNLTIRNIECRYIQVPSKNGACVRLEGRGLTLDHVYFHSSETGLLETAKQHGYIVIENSRFEQLGKAGQAHAMYLNNANLHFRRSMVLASKDQGHGIKSRGAVTVIEDSVLAGFSSNDSRLVDISNGGKLTITGSILQQGQYSVNHQAIGYGLEGMKHADNSVHISDNVIILERHGSNLLYKAADKAPTPTIFRNVIVGADSSDENNFHFKTRAQAGWPAAPMLPALLCQSGQKC